MNKTLTTKQFILSQLIILLLGLAFIGWLYLFLNQSAENKSYLARGGPVTTLPTSITLELSSPDDNLLILTPQILFTGKTLPHATVLISSPTKDVALEARADGIFSQTINLDEGVNKFVVVVFDKIGEQKTTERTIFYSKEKIL